MRAKPQSFERLDHSSIVIGVSAHVSRVQKREIKAGRNVPSVPPKTVLPMSLMQLVCRLLCYEVMASGVKMSEDRDVCSRFAGIV